MNEADSCHRISELIGRVWKDPKICQPKNFELDIQTVFVLFLIQYAVPAQLIELVIRVELEKPTTNDILIIFIFEK